MKARLAISLFLCLMACGDDTAADGGDGTDAANGEDSAVDGGAEDVSTAADIGLDSSAADAPSSDAAEGDAGPVRDPMENLSASGILDERDGVFAFPGATGHARFSTGGRGGEVFCVNTLEDINVDGDGLISYREAIEGNNEADVTPRIVTFCVSGEIFTGTERVLNNTGLLTVACQTAPSPGVVITGYRPVGLDNNADHQVWRHCDVKPRDTLQAGLNSNQRNVTIGGGPAAAPDNLMFDHMSLMYSTDDSFSVFVNRTTNTMVPSDITLSHSIIGEGDTTCHRSDDECGNPAAGPTGDYRWPNHSMGPHFASLNGTSIAGVSVIANLIGNTNARNPQMRGVSPGEVANNLLFNVHSNGVYVTPPANNAPNAVYIEGNIIKEGPDDRGTEHIIVRGSMPVINGNTRISNEGEVTSTNFNGTDLMELRAGPREYTTGDNAFDLACVGASRPLRDSEDERLVREVNGTGTDPVLESAEVGIGPRIPPIIPPCSPGQFCFYEPTVDDQGQRDYSTYETAGRHPDDYDTDGDGIADAWEMLVADGDPDDAIDGLEDIDHTTDADGDGYLDVEEWLNFLARCPGV